MKKLTTISTLILLFTLPILAQSEPMNFLSSYDEFRNYSNGQWSQWYNSQNETVIITMSPTTVIVSTTNRSTGVVRKITLTKGRVIQNGTQTDPDGDKAQVTIMEVTDQEGRSLRLHITNWLELPNINFKLAYPTFEIIYHCKIA